MRKLFRRIPKALRDTLESGGEDNAPLYGIDMTTHHPSFLALARDTRITDIIAKLIGENIVLQHSKTVHKTPANPEGPRPGGGPVRFHQDFAYFPHTNYDVLAAMLVLDDFTEENVRRCFRRLVHNAARIQRGCEGLLYHLLFAIVVSCTVLRHRTK